MQLHLRFLFVLIIGLLSLQTTYAAKVIKSQGKKVLLSIHEAEIFDKGDKLNVYDSKNKKRAILLVEQVKGNKAIARVLKGKAQKNWTALAADKKPGQSAKKETSKQSAQQKDAFPKWNFGVVGGFSSLTMNVDMGTEVVANTGSNLGVSAFARYHWKNSISIMGTLGYHGFNSTGKATGNVCDSGINCKTDISFLGGEAWAQWYLSRGKIAYWLGGGASFSFPLTKTSNALNEEAIGVSNFMLFGVGFDYYLQSQKAIPFWFEIAQMPATATVKATYIGIKLGYQF